MEIESYFANIPKQFDVTKAVYELKEL